MVLNIICSLLITTISMFFGLFFIHVYAGVPYKEIIIRPHIAVSTAVSISVAFQLGTTRLEIMACFVVGIIGCYLGQLLFAETFDPKK